MNKKRKKRTAIFLTVNILLCLLGCQKNDFTKHSSSSDSLVIYILEDNYQMWELEALIDKYQSENPDQQVELQIGIKKETDGREQVIQRLNNAIIAGKGPDILVLEGLPQEKYVEQGMLVDLKTYVEKIETDNDLFEPIVNSYKTNGTQYGIPYCFALFNVAANGKNDHIPDIDTLTDLTAYLKSINNNGERELFEKWSYDQIISMMYRLYVAETTGFLENISCEGIKNYYEAIYETYSMADMLEVEKAGKTMEKVSLLPLGYESFDLVATGDVELAFDYIETPANLRNLILLQQNGYETKLLRSENELMCVPAITFGVVNTTEKSAMIEEFLSFAFSKNVQEEIDTLPVNREAMKEKLQSGEQEKITLVNDEYNTEKTLEYTPLSEKETDIWLDLFEHTNCVGMTDQKIFQIIMQQAVNVIKENMTAAAAAEEAYRQITIYQNE